MCGGVMMGMGVQVSNSLEMHPAINPHKTAEEKKATILKILVFHDDGRGLIPLMGS